MKFQATNANGIGNRFRCFLAALRMSEDSTVYWSPELKDGVTKPEILNGRIDPIEDLIETDKSTEFDYTAWHIPKFSYFTKACESGNRSLFSLYENMDPRAKEDYLRLRKAYLRPTKKVQKLAVPGFHVGFQLRTKSELINPPKDRIDPSIYDFIERVQYPVFVAADSQELSNRLAANPNVFVFRNQYKYNFDLEWNWSMAEILTMAGCRTLYVTPGSTYGEMGYLFGDYKPIMRYTSHPIHEDELSTLKKPKIIV